MSFKPNGYFFFIIFQILYPTYHKLNGRFYVFILRLKKVLNLFFCVYVRKLPYLNIGF